MIDRLEKEVDMLERHLQVLRMVIENEPIGIVKMSNETGYPHHKVRYSLRVLQRRTSSNRPARAPSPPSAPRSSSTNSTAKVDEIVGKMEAMKIDAAAEAE